MDYCSVFNGIEYGFHGVIHRKDKTSTQLPEPPSGIHEGRAVRKEREGGKHLIKIMGNLPDFLLRFSIVQISSSDAFGYPHEEVCRCLANLPLLIFFQIPLLKYF